MKVSVICDGCGISFDREKTEVTRSLKVGRKQFHSRKCMGVGRIEHIPIEKRMHPENIRRGSQKDEFSEFRVYLKRANNRKSKREISITLPYLKRLWEEQQGICPLTGWSMIPASDKERAFPITASLDRIDNALGYIEGNVRYVCTMANLARNSWSDAELIGFCRQVTLHHKDIDAGILATHAYKQGSTR